MESFLNDAKPEFPARFPDADHHIDTLGQLGGKTDNFAQSSSDLVSFHCMAKPLRSGDPESETSPGEGGSNVEAQTVAKKAKICCKYPLKIRDRLECFGTPQRGSPHAESDQRQRRFRP